MDDYRFECIYRNPEKSLRKFSQYAFLLTPDYSVYSDMNQWRQLESVAHNRWYGNMGGRGTFAAGKAVAYVYESDTGFSPDGKLYGVKVLKGIEGSGKHSLPESSHSSMAYLKMNSDGTFNMMRIYDNEHNLRLEIAYHPEQTIAKGKSKVLHYHVYGKKFSKNEKSSFRRITEVLHKNSRIYK